MEDPILNRDLGEVKELQTRWSQYRDFVTMAMRQQPISAQAEMKFMELKSRIAMLHDSFMNSLKHDQQVGQNMMNIVTDIILLKKAARATEAEKQKFEFDWNECYLLLSETSSSMEEEVKRLASINERAYNAAQRRDLMKARIEMFFKSKPVHALGFVIGFAAAIWAAQTFWGFEKLRNISATRGVFLMVVDNIWRPYINPDFAYQDWAEVRQDSDYIPSKAPNGDPLPVTIEDNSGLNYETFVNNELAVLGMNRTQMADMKALLDKRKDFRVDRLKANSNDVRYYYVLMPTTNDAKLLADIWIQSFRNNLDKAQQDHLRVNMFVHRNANAIFVGISPEIFREEHIRRKFEFEFEKSPNLLAFESGG